MRDAIIGGILIGVGYLFFNTHKAEAEWRERSCVKDGYSLYGRKLFYDCRNEGSIIGNRSNIQSNDPDSTYAGDHYVRWTYGMVKNPPHHKKVFDRISQEIEPADFAEWQEVADKTNMVLSGYAAESFASDKHLNKPNCRCGAELQWDDWRKAWYCIECPFNTYNTDSFAAEGEDWRGMSAEESTPYKYVGWQVIVPSSFGYRMSKIHATADKGDTTLCGVNLNKGFKEVFFFDEPPTSMCGRCRKSIEKRWSAESFASIHDNQIREWHTLVRCRFCHSTISKNGLRKHYRTDVCRLNQMRNMGRYWRPSDEKSFSAEERARDKRGRLIPKIGVNKWGNNYWKDGVTYQQWKYRHPACLRVFAEGWGVDLKTLSQKEKDYVKQLYEEDVDTQNALKSLIRKHKVRATNAPSDVKPAIVSSSSYVKPTTTSTKEFYLDYHDNFSNSHKWYAGLGVNGKFVIAHGRLEGYGRAGGISVSNPTTEDDKDSWAKLSKIEANKLKKGYNPAGSIPASHKKVMMNKLGVTSVPTPTATPSKPVGGSVGGFGGATGGFGVPTPVIDATPSPPPVPTPPSDVPRLKAMLALDFTKHGHGIKFPAIVQRKLDGVRCLATRNDKGKIILQSRQNNAFSDLEHIKEDIKDMQLPPNIVLDGELYSHAGKLSFQKLAGMVRRHSLNEAEREEIKEIRYHVYDMIDLNNPDRTFTDRHAYLKRLTDNSEPNYIDLVKNFEVRSVDEADKLHSQFVESGYEGLMFRNKDSPYEGRRSRHLQKYKKFDDDEFEIVGYEEARGKDAGTVIWVLQTADGQQFRARPKGTLAERRKMFNNGDSYIGKMLTVKYFGLTDGGIPRFPIGITVRDYEAETFEARSGKRMYCPKCKKNRTWNNGFKKQRMEKGDNPYDFVFYTCQKCEYAYDPKTSKEIKDWRTKYGYEAETYAADKPEEYCHHLYSEDEG